MANDPSLLQAQGLTSLPQQDGMEVGTNLLPTLNRTVDRLAHMPEEVYDLTAESHLSRFIKPLLGDPGVGRLDKAEILARLQHSLHGADFWDLDRFYGAIFGTARFVGESLTQDPFTEFLTDEDWIEIGAKDDAYRARIENLARAINYGATPIGMELAAEALLGCDVDIYESFVTADRTVQTYADLQGLGNYSDLESYLYGDLEGPETSVVGSLNRSVFTIAPKRAITEEERYSIVQVLSVLKPAASVLRIEPLGSSYLTGVPIRSIEADSEMWRITQTVEGSAKKKPPFASYQGEAWSQIPSMSGLSSYAMNPEGEVVQYNVVGHLRSNRRNSRGMVIVYSYTPDLAIISLSALFGGRIVSDGIMVRHMLANSVRGGTYTVSFSSDYYELEDEFTPDPRVNVLTYDGYYNVNAKHPILFTGGVKTSQDFWCTDDRAQSDATSECIEIRLVTPRLINHVSVDVAKFPQQVKVQALDKDTQEWVTLRQWTIHDTFPAKIDGRSGEVHPQHSVKGHWQRLSATTGAVRAERVRLVLTRGPYGEAPRDWLNRPLPYSLAAKNFDVGYRIRDRRDVPEPDESLGGAFATAIDGAGNVVTLDVLEQKAENLLLDTGTWMCEPQPTNRAVVNLYLDVRQSDGSSQVVDTFRFSPIRSGSHLNVYWADQEAGEHSQFTASNQTLPTLQRGVITNTAKGLTVSDGNEAWLNVDNGDLHFDPMTVDWWMGFDFSFVAPAITNVGLRTLYDDGTVSLHAGYDLADSATKIVARLTDAMGTVVRETSVPINTAARERIVVSLAFDLASQGLVLETRIGTTNTRVDVVAGEADWARPEEVFLLGSPGVAGSGIYLVGFFLKVGVDPVEVQSLASEFEAYTASPSVTSGIPDKTYSAIIRYSPTFATEDEVVLRGGPPRLYEGLVWHPVARDYTVTKGDIKVPVTLAKFWKFEFTNLVPDLVESFVPITRHVRTFPPAISGFNTARPQRAPDNQWPALKPSMKVASDVQFMDTPFEGYARSGRLPPTAGNYVPDVQQAASMRERFSWLYGLQPWQVGSTAPRFAEVGVHRYDEFDIVDTSKVAYFIGLRDVEAFRTDHQMDDDTQVYHERFLDDLNLEDGYTWNLNPGMLFAPEPGSVVTSVPFPSRHPVRGVQFATTQSDAVQIIPDDDFRDSIRLIESTWDDSTQWHSHGDATLLYSAIDYSIIVNRDVTSISFGGGSSVAGGRLVLPPVQPVFAYDASEDAEILSQAEGGLESPGAATGPLGMIHAAARVTALTDIGNPLVLQIIGSDGSVLAEHEQAFIKGETKEWYVGYQVGAYERISEAFWHPRTIVNPLPYLVGTDDPPDATGAVIETAPDEIVRVRLIQRGGSTDAFEVHRLSIFEDAIFWEFSNDSGDTWFPALGIRNNPDGVLLFPERSNALRWRATTTRSNRAVSSIQIRPWYEKQMGTVAGIPQRGPNLSAWDQAPPIHDDPEFKMWHIPVPKWWWREGQSFPVLPIPGQPLTSEFSDFYARSGLTESLTAPADVISTHFTAGRQGPEVLPEVQDVALRGLTIFRRSNAETDDPVVDEGHGLALHDDGIIRPPDSPPF